MINYKKDSTYLQQLQRVEILGAFFSFQCNDSETCLEIFADGTEASLVHIAKQVPASQ